MPSVNLNSALLELDEARATDEDISNIVHFGTDDRDAVAKIVYEMGLELKELRESYDDFDSKYFEYGYCEDLYQDMEMFLENDLDFENPWVQTDNRVQPRYADEVG
jgi:hypothetical protein